MRYRNFALAFGGATLLWLQVEDNSVPGAVALGLAGVLLIVGRWNWVRRDLSALLRTTLAGALAGLLVAPAAALLMILKTGVHAHAVPDYPPAQILAVLSRAPLWALAGALAGIGVALAAKAVKA